MIRILGWNMDTHKWNHLFWWTRDALSGLERAKHDAIHFGVNRKYSAYVAVGPDSVFDGEIDDND